MRMYTVGPTLWQLMTLIITVLVTLYFVLTFGHEEEPVVPVS
jgi:hypothetical protein